ncbi:MAG: cyclic nucleotide-binding domain-containing protein [Magnetococcales bacterium]|nr:cyclic nucleotide-binding domain-containing protein [Magnetococcales bacterium]
MKEILHLTPEQIVKIIRSLPFFAAFDPDEQIRFAGDETRLSCYHNGEFLIQEGEEDHALFFLLVGAASVVKEGTVIPLAMLGPGDMFGEVGFLMPRRRTTNVIVHPPAMTAPETATHPEDLTPSIFHTLLAESDPTATAVAIRFRRSILQKLERQTRITLKNQIIQCLMERVENMNERLTHLTGHPPQLPIDQELEIALRQEKKPSPATLEQTKERIISQLVAFVEELNRQMVAMPASLRS